MNKNSSLTYAYLLNGKGGGQSLTWEEIKRWTPDKGVLWIHLNFTQPEAQQWLKQHLDHISYLALTAEDVRPRTISEEHYLLVFLRGVNLNPREDPEDMVSIRIFINKDMIVTTHKRNLISTKDISDALQKNIGPKTPGEFITMINERLTYHMSEVIEELSDTVDELENKMIKEESHELRPKIAEIRREAIDFKRYLTPQREAIHQLMHVKTPLINEDNILYLRESNDRLYRYIEDLDSAREQASITQEELSSRLTEKMESRMYVLSIVAVIFLPLTFITGLLGINVAGIPGATNHYAFLTVSLICLVICILLYLVLRHKKWL